MIRPAIVNAPNDSVIREAVWLAHCEVQRNLWGMRAIKEACGQAVVSAERQPFTTAHSYDLNDDIRAVEAVRADYERRMERVARLNEDMQSDLPREAQYVIPFGYRVRYNVQLNLREAYHWLELRSTPQGHRRAPGSEARAATALLSASGPGSRPGRRSARQRSSPR